VSFHGLIEFRYLRDLSIVYVVREGGMPLQKVLQMRIGDVNGLPSVSRQELLEKYLKVRRKLFPTLDLTFPTDDGAFFMPVKFKQNITRMLKRANQPVTPYHPSKLSEEQITALEGLQFEFQRPRFQIGLASGFLSLMALRPEEVANLRKGDISIDDRDLFLRDTKSQQNQRMPIHPLLLPPLERYLRHLDHNEPLFIRQSKKQWDRKDVFRATTELAKRFGVNSINPRRLRKTVGNLIYRSSGSITVTRLGLRHGHESTTLANYVDEASRADLYEAMNNYPDFDLSDNGE